MDTETRYNERMDINLIEASIQDDSPVSQAVRYMELVKQSGKLPAAQIKRLIREIQNELSSAWKFYMGLGADRQALVVADGFTSFPLSLARHCAHVVVFGLTKKEKRLLEELAELKGLSNVICVDTLDNLATQFDVIVIGTGEDGLGGRPGLIDELRKFIHASTELWMITSNELSLARLRRQLRRLVLQIAGRRRRSRAEQQLLRLPSVTRPLVKSRQARQILKRVGCQPFAIVGLTPSLTRLRAARPLKDLRMQHTNGTTTASPQKLTAAEVVIGATPSRVDHSFLERLLRHLSQEALPDPEIHDYRISSSGKVLLFAGTKGTSQPTHLIKLPLNEVADFRLQLNYQALERIAKSDIIGPERWSFFPRPVTAGRFDGQAYYVESILHGPSGDRVHLNGQARERLAHEIFTFWLGVQTSMARSYFLDYHDFEHWIARPLKSAFDYFDLQRRRHTVQERLLARLQDTFVEQSFLLTIIHGDFSLKNIILDRQHHTLLGVIDWDMANLLYFPVLDLFHFFVRLQRDSYRKSPVLVLWELLERPGQDSTFSQLLELYMDAFELTPELLRTMVILYWVQRILAHKGTMKILDPRFMRRNVGAVLHFFEETFVER